MVDPEDSTVFLIVIGFAVDVGVGVGVGVDLLNMLPRTPPSCGELAVLFPSFTLPRTRAMTKITTKSPIKSEIILLKSLIVSCSITQSIWNVNSALLKLLDKLFFSSILKLHVC